MIGFPSDGGLVGSGVTGTSALGLSAVWRCLDILSNGVSQLPWREYRGNLELPASRLVNRPQADRTRREWTSLVVSTLALYDIVYLLHVGGEDAEGIPTALWPLAPGTVQPVIAYDTEWSDIIPPDEYYVGQTRVPASQLTILRRSPQPGISDQSSGVIKLARITFAAAIAAEGFSSRYWQGGGATNGYLTTEANMPSSVAEEFSTRWAERRTRGPDYTPVLTGGLKWASTGADPTTESAVEARRELVADIGRYFGMPTRLLNAPTGDSETYTSTPAANQDLVRYSLQNFIGAIEDGITDLLPGGRHLVIDPERLTRGTLLEQAQAYQLLTGGKAVMAVDEVRERLGLGPVESPDELNPPATEGASSGMPMAVDARARIGRS